MKNSPKLLKYDKFNSAYYNIFDISHYKLRLLGKIILLFIIIFIMLYIQFVNGPIIFLEGDLDKFLETTKGVKDAANNANLNVSGNNVNVSIPDINVQNPNINVPSS
jgi:hypothetical protein